MVRWLVLVLVGGAAVAGCGGDSDTSTSPREVRGTLTVAGASSLRAAFEDIGARFEAEHEGVDVRFSFDASSALATQIEEGAPADVFASADEANMQRLVDADLLAGSPEVFARNQLAIVVKAGNPEGVERLADLAGVGVVALCAAEVPCGRYADQVLREAGVTLPIERVSRAQNATATLTAVTEGDADAGIVYVTDVRSAGDAAHRVSIPEADNAVAAYPIAVVAAAANRGAADSFAALVVASEGRAILEEHGFLAP